jgi:N,N'-diacetyllegionaminate synthase
LHVIAEAGNNHDGDVATAERLIDIAAEAGADSVKFQVIHPEGLYLAEFPTADGYRPNEVIAARRRHQLSHADYERLARHCADRGIAFSASIFDTEGIALLDRLDAPYIKIASCDLNNIRLIRAAAATGRKLVISTGMSTFEEVERTLDALSGHDDIVLLHCVSVYPAALEQMNLRFLEQLAATGFPVGLSDHTPDPTASAIALALGASWFEKHFTLDRTREGFDHAYALEPGELNEYVATLRAAQAALTPAAEKVGPAEREVARRARRAVYAARDLEAGTQLTDEDLLVVRPEGPLDAAAAERVVGRRLTAPLRRYEPLRWELLA